ARVRRPAEDQLPVHAAAVPRAPGGGAVQPRLPADHADAGVPALGARQLLPVGLAGDRPRPLPGGRAAVDAGLPAADAEAGLRPGLVADGGQVPGDRQHLFHDADAGDDADVPGADDGGLSHPAGRSAAGAYCAGQLQPQCSAKAPGGSDEQGHEPEEGTEEETGQDDEGEEGREAGEERKQALRASLSAFRPITMRHVLTLFLLVFPLQWPAAHAMPPPPDWLGELDALYDSEIRVADLEDRAFQPGHWWDVAGPLVTGARGFTTEDIGRSSEGRPLRHVAW